MLVLLRCVRTGKLSHQMSSTFKLRGFKLIISHAAVFFFFFFEEHVKAKIEI